MEYPHFLFGFNAVEVGFFAALLQLGLEDFLPLLELLLQVGLVKVLRRYLLVILNALVLQVLVEPAEFFDFLGVFLQLVCQSLARLLVVVLLAQILLLRILDELFGK